MVPTAAKFGLAAAAVTAAVVGIGVAVDNYNQKALSSNLEEHFGNIKLSAQEVQDIASGILDQKYLANVEVALNEVKNADKLREDAEEALKSNDVLEFKSRVGIKLTPEEQEDYTSNIETFAKNKIKELESRTFAAHIHVKRISEVLRKARHWPRTSRNGLQRIMLNWMDYLASYHKRSLRH